MGYLVYDVEAAVDGEVAPPWEPPAENPDVFPPVWSFRVLTVGTLEFDNDLNLVSAGVCGSGCGAPEEEILAAWSDRAQTHRLVDYNGRGFDIPLLANRCYRYGVDMGWYYALQPDQYGKVSKWSKAYRDRYAGMHIDLTEQWSNFRAGPYMPLDAMCKLMGLPGKDVSLGGAAVGDAWAQGRHEEIDRYVMEDVIQTAFVFLRMKLMFGEISLEKYRDRAGALFSKIENGTKYTHLTSAANREAVLLG